MKRPATGAELRAGYLDTLQRMFDSNTARMGKDLELAWPLFLGVSALSTLVGVAVLRVVLSLTVDSGRVWLAIIGVVPALLLAALCLIALGWSWWRSRVDPADRRPYVVAFLMGLTTVGVCIEAFAGLTELLWRHGPVTGAAGSAPSLWGTERYFAWHLVDSVPLLDIPRTLHWSEPGGFVDHWSGSLALAFRVVVLLPAIQMLVAGYRYLHARNLKRQQRGRPVGMGSGEAVAAAGYAGATLLTTAVLFAALVLLAEPGSWGDRRLDDLIPAQAVVGDLEIPLDWVLAVPVVVLLLGASALVFPFASELSYTTFLRHVRRRSVLAGAIAFLASLLVYLNGLATTAQLTLARVGLAETTSGMPDAGSVSVSGWLSWHALDTIPALRVTETLHWQPAVVFADRWSGSVAVTYKVVFVAVVFIWLPRLVLSYTHHSRSGVGERGVLGSARELLSQLDRTVTLLDRTAKAPGNRRHAAWNLHQSAATAIRDAEDQVEAVRKVFGDGEVTESADRAMAAITDWHGALSPFIVDERTPVEAHREGCLAAVDDYRTAVERALAIERRALRRFSR